MRTLTSEDALREGWTVLRSSTGIPHMVSPEGKVWRKVPLDDAEIVVAGVPLAWQMSTAGLLAAMRAQHYSKRGPA